MNDSDKNMEGNSEMKSNFKIDSLRSGVQQTIEDHVRSSQVSFDPSPQQSDDVEDNLKCGYGPCEPECLKPCTGVVCYMVCYCVVGLSISMGSNGFLSTGISTIEKRFELSSFWSSWIAASYDIASVPGLIIVSYWGAVGHRTRWMAVGSTLAGIGSILFVLPHFLTEPYDPYASRVRDEACSFNTSGLVDAKGDDGSFSGLKLYFIMFICANVLIGFGNAPLPTLGITYLDDIVPRDTFAFCLALFYAFGVLGPAIGFIVGGVLLAEYIDFDRVPADEITVQVEDQRFLGAWWPGFLVTAFLTLTGATALFGFPRDIPGAAEIRAKRVSEAYRHSETHIEPGFGTTLSDLPKSLFMLLKNWAYVLCSLLTCTESLLIAGFTVYGPKYLENQYALPSDLSSYIFGGLAIPGAAGGTILGGYLIKKFSMNCCTILKMQAIGAFLSLLITPLFFLVCGSPDLVGLTVDYVNSTTTRGYNATCNSDCVCPYLYDPVCGRDSVLYFSACHAGCHDKEGLGPTLYFNCSCITSESPGNIAYDATTDICSEDCTTFLVIFAILWFAILFLTFFVSTTNATVVVRVVPSVQRSFGIGVQWILLRLLGTIPGPVVVGAALDGSCDVWSQQNSSGSCERYDPNAMALYMFMIGAIFKFASTVFAFACWLVYKPPIILEKSDDETDNGIDNLGNTVQFNSGTERF
ncbi:unnamed protein product [Owenia fusiformis]|uniref:Solute carrier organic anion transporter family member n=1 Tax=Owenia fusiformis TaxID=6347 RepID=A0A8S4N4J7_OWEFU|nr:unnamed protein product [Owenia fusiformis]